MMKNGFYDAFVLAGTLLAGLLVIFIFNAIANRFSENAQNIATICDRVGIGYSMKTNFFGNITRIYVDMTKKDAIDE